MVIQIEEALKKPDGKRWRLHQDRGKAAFLKSARALADTLWNYGQLTPEVKKKRHCIFWIIRKQNWRWEDDGGKYVEHGCEHQTENKLLSHSRRKKRFQSIIFINVHGRLAMFVRIDWKAKYSKEKGLCRKYVIFRSRKQIVGLDISCQ